VTGTRPAAVVLDWGGTITPSPDADLRDLWRAVAAVCLPGDPARRRGLAQALESVEKRWWAAAAPGARTGTLTEIMAYASRALGFDVGSAARHVAVSGALDARVPHTVCDPDALLLLHLLRVRGLRVGLLTDTRWPPDWHARWLARDGLLGLLDARIYTSELPFSKPHPGAFHTVLAALRIHDPRSVVFVGDRLDADVAGARGVGMRAVLLDDGAERPSSPQAAAAAPRPEPDAVIGHLGGLLEVLDAWGATARHRAELPVAPEDAAWPGAGS
jgi:putative hydrolase of the HAD superfamily